MSPLQPALTPIALTSAASPAAATPKDPKLAKVAQQFEAIFVRQMLAEARKTHLSNADDTLGGQGMDTFRQMQDERFADIASERGAFGLAKMIEAQLARQAAAAPAPADGGK